MPEMVHIPREFIFEILKKEKDHRRLEEFAADLFSASEGVRYTTTAPTGDNGRDAYAQLVGGIALVCASTERERIKHKIKEDIDKQAKSPMTILRFHYCSIHSLSEPVRDELLAHAATVLSKRAIIQIHGLVQLVDRASARQEVFSKTYSRELALFASFYRRTLELGSQRERADVLRIVLACAFHPEMKQQRGEVVRNLLLLALAEEKPRTASEILAFVASELALENTPREAFIAEGLQQLVNQGEVGHTPNGYVLTTKGARAVASQLGAAAADSLDGHELFINRLGNASKSLSKSQQSKIWTQIQFKLGE